MNLTKTFFIILLAIPFFSCTKGQKVPTILYEAQEKIISYPDSALLLLEYYCDPTLKHINKIEDKLARAKYALLYSQALYECNFLIKSDSIINIATNYYNSTEYNNLCNKAREEMIKYDTLVLDKAKAFYYKGRVYEGAGRIEEAIGAYLDAVQVLDGFKKERARLGLSKVILDEVYIRGRGYGALAKLLQEQYSLKEALYYYREAASAYKSLGDTKRLLGIVEGMALAQYYLNNYEGALGDYNSAINYAYELKDTAKVISLSRGMAALIFHFTSNASLTMDVLINTSEKFGYALGNSDYPLLASVYLKEGRIARAQFFFNKSLESKAGYTAHQKVGMYAIGARIESRMGDFKKAYIYSSRGAAISDSLNRAERDNLVVELIQKNRFKQLNLESIAQKEKHGYLTVIYTLLIIIFAILVTIAAVVIVVHRRKIARKSLEAESYLQQLNEVEFTKGNLIEELDSKVEKEALLKELLLSRFAEVRELANTYYEYGYSKNLQKKVEEILSVQLLQGESFVIIEKIINEGRNNAITKIRAEFPTLKEENIKLLCLIYAGFSPQGICAVLSDTPQNVYVKKYRLKNKLAGFIEIHPEADFK